MPVGSGLQAAFQASQIGQANAAMAQQFALAIQKLGVAEKQFNERLKMERDIFELDKQKFQARLDLQAVQKDMLQTQLDQLQFQQQQQQETQKAYGEFQEKQYGPYLAALAAGKDAEVLRRQTDLAFSQLPPAAQQMFLAAEEGRLRLEAYPAMQRAKIAEMVAQARAASGTVSDMVKLMPEVRQEMVRAATGFDLDERRKQWTTQHQNINSQVGDLGRQLGAVALEAGATGLGELAMQLSEQAKQGFNASNWSGMIEQAKNTGNATIKSKVLVIERDFQRLLNERQRVVAQQNLDQNRHQFAEQLVNGLAGKLDLVAAGVDDAKGLALNLKQYTRRIGNLFQMLSSNPQSALHNYLSKPVPEQADEDALRNEINMATSDPLERAQLWDAIYQLTTSNRWVTKQQTLESNEIFLPGTTKAPSGPRAYTTFGEQ